MQIERAIERPHDRAGALAVGADHDPVGPHEILDRRALAQKFRIGGDVEPALRPYPAQDLGNLATGADRHRRLGHDDRIIGQRPPDLLGGGEDVRKIGMPVAAPRGRADGDEHRVGPGNSRREIGGEGKPARRSVIGHERVETRLEDRHFAPLQARDLAPILVDACDLDAELGEARPRDQPNIPGTDYRNAHLG